MLADMINSIRGAGFDLRIEIKDDDDEGRKEPIVSVEAISEDTTIGNAYNFDNTKDFFTLVYQGIADIDNDLRLLNYKECS